jgi:hypothetical protein
MERIDLNFAWQKTMYGGFFSGNVEFEQAVAAGICN